MIQVLLDVKLGNPKPSMIQWYLIMGRVMWDWRTNLCVMFAWLWPWPQVTVKIMIIIGLTLNRQTILIHSATKNGWPSINHSNLFNFL